MKIDWITGFVSNSSLSRADNFAIILLYSCAEGFASAENAIFVFVKKLCFLFDRSAGQYFGADHGRGYPFVRAEIAQDDDTFFPVLGKTDCDHLLFEVEPLV